MTAGAGLPPDGASHREVVDLGARSTRVWLGSGLYPRLWEAVRERHPAAERCGLAVDGLVAALWPVPPAPEGLEVLEHVLPAGEEAKDRIHLAALQDRWIGLRRDEPVVVVGGGAALDVGGLAAATVRRGLPWIGVATTIVAMADASVGGKTAVNHPAGKNLLGTYHPPELVLSDVDLLATLDAREATAGLAELYKCGRLGDAALVARLRDGAPFGPADLTDMLHRAVAVKARLVEVDERDAGARRLLNYGHTVGHALERVLGNARMRHGEAVAIGMHAAARLAVARGLMPSEECARQREDLLRLGLPVDVPAEARGEDVLRVLGFDKKRPAGRRHVFVLPEGASGARVVEDVSDEELAALLEG